MPNLYLGKDLNKCYCFNHENQLFRLLADQPAVIDPCNPSPCGPYASCTVSIHQEPICTCQAYHYGAPCNPECILHSDCSPSRACINSRCINPCISGCGIDSHCKVINHQPVCFCP